MGPTRDEAFRMFMDYTHWRVDARLVRAYIDKAATGIDWLESLGVDFVEPTTYFPGGQYTWHLVRSDSGEAAPAGAATMMRVLTERAKELGVRILLQTPAKRILKEGGAAVGVLAEDRGAEPVEVRAGAVIVATGGFGDNPDMIKRLTGYEWGRDLHSFRIPGMEGDGIRMAWEAGAARGEMSMELIFGIPNGDMIPEMHETFRQPHLMVNLDGGRFIDEGVMPNTTFTGNAISIQRERTAFLLFDETIKRHMQNVGFDFIHVPFPHMKVGDLDALIGDFRAHGSTDVFVAGSLDELAEQTGIDRDGLLRTVEEYNAACARGHDPLFAKGHRFLRPLLSPPYYAARHFPGAYGSLGGIKIDHRPRVLDKDRRPIAGFYAAGTDANSIYGDSYVFILPGNTMGFAINSGRIAGEEAVRYAQSLKGGPADG